MPEETVTPQKTAVLGQIQTCQSSFEGSEDTDGPTGIQCLYPTLPLSSRKPILILRKVLRQGP